MNEIERARALLAKATPDNDEDREMLRRIRVLDSRMPWNEADADAIAFARNVVGPLLTAFEEMQNHEQECDCPGDDYHEAVRLALKALSDNLPEGE